MTMYNKITDHIGMVLACTCLLHCLTLPLFLLLLPAHGHDDTFHIVVVIATIFVSGGALIHGFQSHCKHIVLSVGGAGFVLITLALAAPTETVEVMTMIVGSIMIIAAHIFNIKHKTNCSKKCSTHNLNKTGE